MSLRWASYVAPKTPKGRLKTQHGRFPSKIVGLLRLKKDCYEFLCVNIVSDKVVRHSLAYLSVQKWFAGDVPTTWKFGRTLSKKAISNRYSSQPSEKSSTNPNRKSTTRNQHSNELKTNSVRWPYKPPKEGGSKTQNDLIQWWLRNGTSYDASWY